MWIRFFNQWKDKDNGFIWFGIILIENYSGTFDLTIGILGLVIVIEIGK